jgi:hypothetical protein
VAFHEPHQTIDRIQVVRNQILVEQLDAIAIFQECHEFHNGSGIDDAAFDEGIVIGEALVGLAKHEAVGHEGSQFVVKRHRVPSGIQSD